MSQYHFHRLLEEMRSPQYNILGETKFSFYLRKAEVKYWNNSIIIGEKDMLDYYFYINSSNMVVGLGKGNLLKMLYCAICWLVIHFCSC